MLSTVEVPDTRIVTVGTDERLVALEVNETCPNADKGSTSPEMKKRIQTIIEKVLMAHLDQGCIVDAEHGIEVEFETTPWVYRNKYTFVDCDTCVEKRCEKKISFYVQPIQGDECSTNETDSIVPDDGGDWQVVNKKLRRVHRRSVLVSDDERVALLRSFRDVCPNRPIPHSIIFRSIYE